MSDRVPAGALGQRAVGTSPAGYTPDKSVQPVLTAFFSSFYVAVIRQRLLSNCVENLNFVCVKY